MNAICRKLNSRRGASILIALLLFLVCAFVGGAVLAAAYQNASRAPAARQEEQDYLAVSSAVQLLKDEITGQKIELLDITTTHTDADGNETSSRSRELAQSYTGILDHLGREALSIFKGSTPNSGYRLTFDLSGHPELSNVQGTLRMGGDDSGYALTILLSNTGGENELELSFPASISSKHTENSWGSDSDSSRTDEVKDTTTVTWTRATVRLTSIPKEAGT